MTYYDNNVHTPQLTKWIRDKWGLGRLYRRMKYLYPYHGPTILLRQIITVADNEQVRFTWRTIYAVMKKERFERAEKNAIKNWVEGLENGRVYVRISPSKARLQGKKQEPLTPSTLNPRNTPKTHIEVKK